LDEEKSKYANLAQQNGLDSIFAQFAEVGKGHNKTYHLLEKSLVNRPPISDWPIIMIGPSGLLVLHKFAVPVLWVGLEKSKQLNLDVRNIVLGSHTEHY
jgi:hypothetical protein